MAAICGGTTGSIEAELHNAPFEEEILTMLARPVAETPLAKDLPRLCRRTTVYLQGEGEATFDAKNEAGEYRRSISETVRDLMVALAAATEDEAVAAEKAAALDQIVADEGEVDEHTLVLPRMFAALGEESPAMQLLRSCHQGVVLCGMQHLKDPKTGVFAKVQTKDIRSQEGWRLYIRLCDLRQVWHARREQCANLWNEANSDHFEVEWQVRVTYDQHYEPSAAMLRITDLDLAADMSEQRQSELRQTLVGDLIVA